MTEPAKALKKRGGILRGFLLGVGVSIAVVTALSFWSQHRLRPIHAEVAGADVSRHGGVTINISSEYGFIRQACNGVCDNLVFEQDSADNLYKAEVRDAAGACVFCGHQGEYVSGGMQVGWRLGGKDKLALQRTTKFAY